MKNKTTTSPITTRKTLRTKIAATKIAAIRTTMKPKTANKKKTNVSPTDKAKALTDMQSDTDVNGSYTGAPKNPREVPVQDADDL